MSSYTSKNSFKSNIQRIWGLLGMPLLAFMLAFGMAQSTPLTDAHAGAKKKVQFGLKFASKGLRAVEKAGRAAQKKRGILGKAGGILAKGARGANKGVRGASRGVGRLSRGINGRLGKSKVGRGFRKGWRRAQRFQNKAINRAFRKCRGRACNWGKQAARIAAPI